MIEIINSATVPGGMVVTVSMPRALVTARAIAASRVPANTPLDTPVRLRIAIPRDAIANRREFYGLDSDAAALEAILREHYHRSNVATQQVPPAPWRECTVEQRATVTGGLDSKVEIMTADTK